MDISVYETITITERFIAVMPGLTQVDLDIVSGTTYRLTFDSDITIGVIKVYQGTQLIYDTSFLPIGIVNDTIYTTEYIALDKRTSFSTNDSVTVSENIALSIFYPGDVFESVTVSESITITIV